MHDWEKNPHLYLTDSDGSFVLKKDGTPRKKGGRPQGATSNYSYSHGQKAKIAARRAVRNKQKAIKKVEKQLKSKRNSLKQTTKMNIEIHSNRPGDPAYLVADISKVKRILEWEPTQSSIDNVVATALKWYNKMHKKEIQ